MPASDIELTSTALNQQAFLDAFAKCGSVGQAATDSGISIGTVYAWDSRDTQGFKAKRSEAAELYLGILEREIHRRAVEGVDHPVIHLGRITDTYKTYSDNLLMFRAKKADPTYRDNSTTEVHVSSTEVKITKITVRSVHDLPPVDQPAPSAGSGQVLPAPKIPPVVEEEDNNG